MDDVPHQIHTHTHMYACECIYMYACEVYMHRYAPWRPSLIWPLLLTMFHHQIHTCIHVYTCWYTCIHVCTCLCTCIGTHHGILLQFDHCYWRCSTIKYNKNVLILLEFSFPREGCLCLIPACMHVRMYVLIFLEFPLAREGCLCLIPVCMFACMYVCMHLSIYIYTHTHTHTHAFSLGCISDLIKYSIRRLDRHILSFS